MHQPFQQSALSTRRVSRRRVDVLPIEGLARPPGIRRPPSEIPEGTRYAGEASGSYRQGRHAAHRAYLGSDVRWPHVVQRSRMSNPRRLRTSRARRWRLPAAPITRARPDTSGSPAFSAFVSWNSRRSHSWTGDLADTHHAPFSLRRARSVLMRTVSIVGLSVVLGAVVVAQPSSRVPTRSPTRALGPSTRPSMSPTPTGAASGWSSAARCST